MSKQTFQSELMEIYDNLEIKYIKNTPYIQGKSELKQAINQLLVKYAPEEKCTTIGERYKCYCHEPAYEDGVSPEQATANYGYNDAIKQYKDNLGVK